MTLPPAAMIALCAATALVIAALQATKGNRTLLLTTWALSVAHLSAAAMLLLDIAGGILPGLGIPADPPGFLSRASCATVGLLTAATAWRWHRRTPRRPAHRKTTPLWAYAAITGCLIRIIAQLTLGDGIAITATPSSLIVHAGILLAGVLLPLALARDWGRTWPRWAYPVPRRLLTVPGLIIGGALLIYFGTALVQMTAETLDGTLEDPAFMWVAVPAYLLWGLGLTLASRNARTAPERASLEPCS